jgi:hypothetical protein
MYGGGFATVPAYLADMFGTKFVGGIHGRLLTAWAAAGVAGPVLVNYIRAYEVAHGVVKGGGLHHDGAHHGGTAGDRLRLQFAGEARGRQASHERRPTQERTIRRPI